MARPAKVYVYKKVKQSLQEWATAYGLSYETLYARIHRLGWPIHKALTEPVRPKA